MSLSIIATAAGVLSLPEIVSSSISYPQEDLLRERSAAALVEVIVDPKGRPVRCETISTFGEKTLADKVCDLQGGFRFKPAFNAAGSTSFSVSRVLEIFSATGTEQGDEIRKITWSGPTIHITGTNLYAERKPPIQRVIDNSEMQLISLSDVTLPVSKLPTSTIGDFLDRQVTVEIDASGRISECQSQSKSQYKPEEAAFDKIACKQLVGYKFDDGLKIGDQNLGYVRSIAVRFKRS